MFHFLQALCGWLWKAEHRIEKQDRPALFNLVKKLVYEDSTEGFNRALDAMKNAQIYKKYEHYKTHVEHDILPRNSEWSLKERFENKLPTHNQNTTNCVEYSFRMTKDIQFTRLKAYNITELVDICLDDSKLYSRRCVDVSHNRNYHLFTNQKSKYLYKNNKMDSKQIIQQSRTQFIVPSETIQDKLYKVDIESGLCECFRGFLKGPCKHKAAVVKKYKMKNFDVLPEDNEKMRAFYHFIGTGVERASGWFRPLLEESSFPPSDWNDNQFSEDENGNASGEINEAEAIEESSESLESMEIDDESEGGDSDEVNNVNSKAECLATFKKEYFYSFNES